jgi:Zn-dependent peptidase ImmA (M78 family)/transcriptional regulator with XRE-family HTH domain
MPNLVAVNGSVLKWARDERAYSIQEAAELIGISVSELNALELGEALPNITLFRRIADKYHYPYATLAMPEPLPPLQPPKDFRTFAGREPTTSPETMLAFEEAIETQGAIAELADVEPALYKKPVLPSASLTSKVAELAKRERTYLGVSDTVQLQRWKDRRTAYKGLREAIESRGVFVFEKDMPTTDCRGFSVYEPVGIPIIIISKNEETPQAKLFTLLHEYAHLLLRDSGLCDEDRKSKSPVERFCNQFAASFLMPAQLIQRELTPILQRGKPVDAETVRHLARRLRVSQESLALRLEELGYAKRGFYDWWKAHAVSDAIPRSTKKPIVTWERRKLAEWGLRYPSVVIEAVKRDVMTTPEAIALLGSGASGKVFTKMRRLLGQ